MTCFRSLADQSDYAQLVSLFCQQIIPLLSKQPSIEPLRTCWLRKRQKLFQEKARLAEKTVSEMKEVVNDLKKNIQEKTGPIVEKMQEIENMLAGKNKEFSSWPFHYSLFDKTRSVLRLLAKNPSYHPLCGKYARLRVQESWIRKDDGPLEQIKEWVLDEILFAPSLEAANRAHEAISWERLDTPALAWFFLEAALRYWNTSESFFESSGELLSKEGFNALPALAEKSAWHEIAEAKNRTPPGYPITVFTSERFKQALQALFNDVQIFSLNGGVTEPIDSDLVGFELHLRENRLWIFAHLGASETRRYYIKRFNEGPSAPSNPLDFLKNLLEKHSQAGSIDIEVDLAFKSENIPKLIERLGLKAPLDSLFFGKSRGTTVAFHGVIVAIDRDERCRRILDYLEKTYKKKEYL